MCACVSVAHVSEQTVPTPDAATTNATTTNAATLTLYGGEVYSSVDPFATALRIDGSTVAWIGSDEAATSSTNLTARTDLAGDLITPGFVDAALDLRAASHLGNVAELAHRLLRAGITTAHVIGPADVAAQLGEYLHVVAYPVDSPTTAGNRAVTLAQLLASDPSALTRGAGQVCVLVDTAEDLGTVEGLLARSDWLGAAQRAGLRVVVDCPDDLDAKLWGSAGVAVTLNPHHRRDLHALLRAGAQVSFSLAGQPWAAVRAGVENGLSARASFNATTRFSHRAAGDAEAGVIAPGATANLVRWQAGNLVVQVADPRVAAWSTDPRSGTPGLPDLSVDPPAAVTTWVNGMVVAEMAHPSN